MLPLEDYIKQIGDDRAAHWLHCHSDASMSGGHSEASCHRTNESLRKKVVHNSSEIEDDVVNKDIEFSSPVGVG